MSVDHGGGDKSPRIWSGRTLMHTAPSLPPQILSCFKISSTRLLKASAYIEHNKMLSYRRETALQGAL